MALQAHRHRDMDSGHECWPPRPNAQASPDVFVNKRGWHRLTDAWEPHCCGPACHPSNLATGSPTVYANGLPVGRVTDQVACGSVAVTGSSDVFAE